MGWQKQKVIVNKPHAFENMDLIESRVISLIAIIGSKGVINMKGRLYLCLLVAVVFILAAGCASTQQGSDVNAKYNDGYTDLIFAAMLGQTATVKSLLARGADVNAKTNLGGTALFFAAAGGHTATVKALLEHGADVNAKTNGGATPLKAAKMGEHAKIIRLLKEAGAE
jgi:FlaG/FlaF family flagellin (archaellin)